MPRRVDHQERRQRIAGALWRIASTRGLEGASLRDVAAEAGISLGQLQHYFATREEMLRFTLEHFSALSGERIRKRVATGYPEPTPRAVLREIAAELLPLSEEQRVALRVQLGYLVRVLHDEGLRPQAREGVLALRGLLADQLRIAAERGELTAGLDPEREAVRLLALTDGLANAVLLDVLAPGAAMGLVDEHLGGVFGG
ncbi:TetR/AcrR family transcriptional regulator [Streptomyces orinoci]|uniref:TetR family transcriptional regulator C-terminal domain-containing protein n=1 Tax=Streptomyces orinoci TaxID=67339 RepID=A0ABV3JQN4_STRON|nr:TetR family transcriptional regulator C-terminal domain-containing protein [Streptomyces orinoci]